ncbi:SusD/RagB family nutrient-binding outer membrane lipoprotein [Agriterribacter sp.]|uniref:SusD/RagB family nutrient-binding outer membrane lipoprotein n=1 Tax=Agriterribacter sp. TaxID=2821509 RepID=UPI002CF7481B|nr:SusD/RagB family nutrient-binding outer membrane lipoprotein [Agriterribacter sp.]HTN09291.1 SusD/RagB family nutrient-binding outer membrane lipoprotein [Agriterribacter sp.]
MKSFIKKLGALVLLSCFASCSKDALRSYDAQQQLNAVEDVNDPFLLSSVIKQTTLFYQGMGYDNSRLPGAVQYMERNFQGGDNYYQNFKYPTDDLYAAMNILKLVDGAIGLADKRGSLAYKGIFKIFRSLLFSFMTDFYGDIYYSEALKGREGILYPKYDKQEDIYTGLLAELDEANTLIKQGTEDISPTYDLMYAGDKIKWQKFANSLKLRLLMRASKKIGDVGAKMTAIVGNPAETPIFTGNDDNAAIPFVGTTKDNSWKGGKLNWDYSEFDRRRPAKTLADKLNSLNDPRLPIWLAPVEKPWTSNPALNGVKISTTDANGFTDESTWEYINRSNPDIAAQSANLLDSNKLYIGFIAGMYGDFLNGNGHYDIANGGIFGNFKVSRFSQLFRQNAHPLLRATIMNSDEVQFILAEAAVKGLISGDADAYYRNGISLSMERWGIPDSKINPYLAQAIIALPGDNNGKLVKIADQKWLALFMVASEAYLDIRRTQLPNIFNNGLLTTYPFPLRFIYPGAELGQNVDAYNAGVATLSPPLDNQFSKMWLLQ